MITLDMCLDYIQKHCKDPHNNIFPVELTSAQKRFIANLCEGKLTNTPRCFGKTFVINLYCKALNYYIDAIKWGEATADDYISLSEMNDGFGDVKPLSKELIRAAYNTNSKMAMREYNFDECDFEKAYKEKLNG